MFFVITYKELWKIPQIDLFLIIELYHFISKNQKLNFVLFFIINILKYMHDFNVQ